MRRGPALLGLDGFEVLAAEVVGGEWQLEVQTTATVVGCAGCGVRADSHGRRTVRVRDLPIGGRPVVLGWRRLPVDLAGGVVEGHSHAIRLANTATNQILAT